MTAPNDDSPGRASASMPRPGDAPDDALSDESPDESPDVPAAQEQPPSYGYGSPAAGTDRAEGDEIEDEGGGSTGGG